MNDRHRAASRVSAELDGQRVGSTRRDFAYARLDAGAVRHPMRALSELSQTLRSGGRLAMVVLDARGSDGPFSLVDPYVLRALLQRAAFCDVRIEPFERPHRASSRHGPRWLVSATRR